MTQGCIITDDRGQHLMTRRSGLKMLRQQLTGVVHLDLQDSDDPGIRAEERERDHVHYRSCSMYVQFASFELSS